MLLSMFFYLLVFFVCISGIYISEHLKPEQRKYAVFIAGLSLLFVSLIAGVRGADVGVDVRVYIIKNCELAKQITSFTGLINNTTLNIGIELVYGLLLYICTRFRYSVQLLLFSLQLLTIVPIYIACSTIKRKYDNFSITLAIMVYLFLYFNNSLNIMRQSVAVAFLILGISMMIDKSKKIGIKKYVPFIIAILFHKTTILGILLLLCIKLISYNRGKINKMLVILLNAVILCIPVFIERLYLLSLELGIRSINLDYYADMFIYKTVNKGWIGTSLSFYSLSFVAFIIFFAIFLIINTIKNNKKEMLNDMVFFRNIVLYGYLIYLVILFSYKTMYGIRISLMLDMFNIIALPMCIANSNNEKIKKTLLIIIIVVCWYMLIMKLGWSGSNIYKFF